jgi:uncharacterized membrane protein
MSEDLDPEELLQVEPEPQPAPAVVEPVAEPLDPDAGPPPVSVDPVVALPPEPLPPPSTYLGSRGRAMLVRGTLLLIAIAVCVAAFVIQMTGTFHVNDSQNLRDLVNRNTLVPKARADVMLRLGGAAVVGGLLALASYRRKRRILPPFARAARTLRTARFFTPLVLPALVRPLLLATEWDSLARVSAVALVALLAERCFRAVAAEAISGRIAVARGFARAGRRVSSALALRMRLVAPETIVVLLAVVFYAVWMSYGTILQHRQFATYAFDLGNYDNMFFNTLHGHPFRTWSVVNQGKNWSMLSNHAELTLFVLLPFYAIKPGSETLLIMQAAAMALGAIPLYFFAVRRLPRSAAMVLALAYLCYAPMHQANFYDVHFQPFALPFTLLTLYALDARRWVLFGLAFLLSLGCREDAPIGFIVVGVYLLLVGQRTRAAIVMTIFATVYFVVIKGIVMPRFGTWWFNDVYKELYPPNENTYGGIMKTLLSNPSYVFKTMFTGDKITLLLLVLAPVAFLPVRRGALWMSLLPAVPFTVLTTAYWPTVQISFQYVLFFVPFLFIATAMALAALRRSAYGGPRLWGALGSLAVATFLTTRVWGAMPPGPGDKFHGGFREIGPFRPVTEAEKDKARDIAELAAKIPAKASVAISENEHPHASAHLEVMALRASYDGADYILYAEGSGGGGGDAAQQALSRGDYELVERRPSGMALLRKKQK